MEGQRTGSEPFDVVSVLRSRRRCQSLRWMRRTRIAFTRSPMLERDPAGARQPLEAVQEVAWRDTELSGQVVEGASKHGVARDDFEDACLDMNKH